MAVSAEIRLKRFIHYGSETPTFLPIAKGSARRQFKEESLTAINSFMAEEKLDLKAITNIILKAFTDGYTVHCEAMIFALAVAARQKLSQNLRELAYNAVRTICKDVNEIFLFINFCFQLSPGKGFGKGLSRVVREWYLNQPPMDLLRSITKQYVFYGWSHTDVIKLCHVPTKENIAFSAVVQYVLRGFEAVKKDFAEKPEAKPVIEYLSSYEEFQFKGTERAVVLECFENLNLTMEHVPAEILCHKWIWPVLIPKLTLPVLLSNLKRLGHMRLINEGQPLADVVITALTNQASVSKSKIHPVDVLITLAKYENLTKLRLEAKARKPIHTKPESQLPLAVNPKIVDALNILLTSSFKTLTPTGLRYLVIVDVRKQMAVGHCYRNNNVKPLMAASIITLGLVKTERSVVVGTYGNGGTVHTIRIGKSLTLKDTFEKFSNTVSVPVDLSQPIIWAKNKVKDFDVFLLITDHQVKQDKMMAPVKALTQYRKKLRRPKTKLVVVATGCIGPFGIADPADPGILEIGGFNAEVPRVIEAFARGAF